MLARLEKVPRREARDDSTFGSDDSFHLKNEEGAGFAADSENEDAEDLVPATRLYIAHAGDCRAVLSHAGVAVDMTRDHKPGVRPDEISRIEASGGWVHNGRLRKFRVLVDL